jgi:hypothetical protein
MSEGDKTAICWMGMMVFFVLLANGLAPIALGLLGILIAVMVIGGLIHAIVEAVRRSVRTRQLGSTRMRQ